MSHPLLLVDAFIDKPFSGNPAGVCVLREEQPASWMQMVALEMNQAETAFVHKRADGSWNLRWFTPQVEVNLCGHATLAAAHALWQHAGETTATLEFHTLSGRLTATRIGDEIQLDFPADFPQSINQVPPVLLKLLGGQPRWFGKGRDDLIAVLDSADAVRNFVPDAEQIASFTSRGLILTAPGDAGSGLDMVSRFFGPKVGINEDSVTGSAHCALGLYWAERLGKAELVGYQASARGGLVRVRLRDERVRLGGRAVTVLRGELVG